jgi:hypothetical protein
MLVFGLDNPDNIIRAVKGEEIGTTIYWKHSEIIVWYRYKF